MIKVTIEREGIEPKILEGEHVSVSMTVSNTEEKTTIAQLQIGMVSNKALLDELQSHIFGVWDILVNNQGVSRNLVFHDMMQTLMGATILKDDKMTVADMPEEAEGH